jgi:hypothetical protein
VFRHGLLLLLHLLDKVKNDQELTLVLDLPTFLSFIFSVMMMYYTANKGIVAKYSFV